MKSFKKFLLMMEGTNEDAKAFHAAVSKHLSDPKNFHQILSSHHVIDGASHFNIPTHALDLPKEMKQRYPSFQGIKLSNSKAQGQGAYASFVSKGKPATGLFGRIRNALGGGIRSHMRISNMSHLSGKLAQDPKMHGFLHKHTKEAWDKNYPIFRHEFEHLAQHASGKISHGTTVKNGASAYHNDPDEIAAHAAQLRVHLDQAFKDHPHEFKGIALNSPNRHKHVINALGRIANKTDDRVMKTAVNHYKGLAKENRTTIHKEIDGHFAENFKAWHDNRQAHVDSVKAKLASRKIKNTGAQIHNQSYPVFGEKKFSKVPANKHTPEGVMYEPEEAMHQVSVYHKAIKDPAERSKFYSANKIKHPYEGLTSGGKLDKSEVWSSVKARFTEDNPHVVSHYLNTMARHFPKIAKNHGKLNYDENERVYHDEMDAHSTPPHEKLTAIKAKKSLK